MDLLTFAQTGFILLSIFCITAFFLMLRKGVANRPAASQKKIIGIYWGVTLGWLALLSGLSLSGFLSDFSTFPPRMGIVLVVPMVLIITFSISKISGEIFDQIPQAWVLNLQAFRVPVEILLWMLFLAEVLPEQMTFEGRNFDVVAGLTGPIFAWLCFANGKYRRTLAIIYNIVGLLLLINIVSIALLSMPTPFRVFTNEPSNTIVATFPIVFLPGILVPLAYSMHIFSLKQLIRRKA